MPANFAFHCRVMGASICIYSVVSEQSRTETRTNEPVHSDAPDGGA